MTDVRRIKELLRERVADLAPTSSRMDTAKACIGVSAASKANVASRSKSALLARRLACGVTSQIREAFCESARPVDARAQSGFQGCAAQSGSMGRSAIEQSYAIGIANEIDT